MPFTMDGVLVVDKPAGPTSHDIVALTRRLLHEDQAGHTGTLDPAASGVLPIVIGRATRLARFLGGSRKSYEALLKLGFATDTQDAGGVAVSPHHPGPFPDREAIDQALEEFRGTFLQQPPAFSAKRIAGRRSYKLARQSAKQAAPQTLPAPVRVTASSIEIATVDGPLVALRVTCSAGFYVRSLAHDLGARLGTGAHLLELRRTTSGDFDLSQAVTLEALSGDPVAAARRLVPMAALLPGLPAAVLTGDGAARARHGRLLGPEDCSVDEPGAVYRLMTREGGLVGLARPHGGPGLLHPFVVLG
jgi:tRNA pseudouridine55 synthase